MRGRGVAGFGVVVWRHWESRRDEEGLRRRWPVDRKVPETRGLRDSIIGGKAAGMNFKLTVLYCHRKIMNSSWLGAPKI